MIKYLETKKRTQNNPAPVYLVLFFLFFKVCVLNEKYLNLSKNKEIF
jgi:hypothetical protein